MPETHNPNFLLTYHTYGPPKGGSSRGPHSSNNNNSSDADNESISSSGAAAAATGGANSTGQADSEGQAGSGPGEQPMTLRRPPRFSQDRGQSEGEGYTGGEGYQSYGPVSHYSFQKAREAIVLPPGLCRPFKVGAHCSLLLWARSSGGPWCVATCAAGEGAWGTPGVFAACAPRREVCGVNTTQAIPPAPYHTLRCNAGEWPAPQ